MAKKRTKNAPDDFDTEAALRANAEKLQEALDSIELHGDGEHSSTIQELARLSVALTGVCSELRQHAKANQRQLESFPLEQVIAHLKTLPDDKRREIADDLTGANAEASLL